MKPKLKQITVPKKIERGRYLANHATVCVDCHSTRDWSRFSGPIVEGTEGKGGEIFDQNLDSQGAILPKILHLPELATGQMVNF